MNSTYISSKKFFLYRFIILVGVSLAMEGCATVPDRVDITRPDNLKELCARRGVQWEWDSVSQVITLTRDNARASFLVGSDVVVIGSEKVILSAPTKRIHSAIIVSPDFEHSVIGRLAKQKVAVLKTYRKIVIDAGHGGKDPGATGRTGLKEKTVVLDISKRIKRILEKKGFKVVMTRKGDEFIPLPKRTEIAAKSKADLFVSIHANSNPWRGAQGFEVYYLKDLEPLEDTDKDQRKRNRWLMVQQLSMKKDNPDLNNIIGDMLSTKKVEESKKFSAYMQRRIPKRVGMKNRGDKESKFFVLRNTLIPSILIEMGFLSNPREERLFKTSEYRQKLAEAIAQSIFDYVQK